MENLIEVQIRVFKGEVLAIFPYYIQNSLYVGCYSTIGQHSQCKWDLKTKKADIFQENQMLNELKSVGYNPILIKRRSHKKYLKAYRSYVNNLK